MDLSKYEALAEKAKSGGEIASWMHIRDLDNNLGYKTGEDGKPDLSCPQRVLLEDRESSVSWKKVKAKMNRRDQRNMRQQGRAYTKHDSEIDSDSDALTAATIKGFENLEIQGRPATADDAAYLLALPVFGPHLQQQIEMHLDDASNFLPEQLASYQAT